MMNNLFLVLYIMDLYYIILVLFMLVLILVTTLIEKKSVMYFIIILFLCLTLQRIVKHNQKQRETFTDSANNNTDTSAATDKLMAAAAKDREINSLQKQVSSVEKELSDLRNVVRLKSLNTAIEKNAKADNFDLAKSQSEQDATLDSLEKELDVLLKLYRKETEKDEIDKYHSLPIFSSCKAKEEGMQYLRDYNNDEQTVQLLENEELMKNLGIDSKSSAELLTQMKKGGGSDNINFNINLV